MGNPLRDMDKQQLLLEQINRVNALAEANDIAPLNLGPLARMALPSAMKQVYDKNNEVIIALGGTPIPWGGPLKDPAAAAAVLNQSMDYTDTLSGGTSDRPEWVPADGVTALQIYIDLVGGDPQGRAWIRGIGEVAVDTLLGTDPNTENGWGVSSYSPENLTADGYVQGGDYLALIGAARTLMTDGATIVVRSKQVGDLQNAVISFVSADGNDSIVFELDKDTRTFGIFSWGGSLDVSIENIENVGSGAVNVIAVTLVTDRADGSANGSDPDTGVPDETDRPPGNPLVAWVIYYSEIALQSITLYDPLPSTTGLSALSETGVV